jgi:hypothetical protein
MNFPAGIPAGTCFAAAPCPRTDGTGRNLRRELLPRGMGDALRHLSALPHGYEFLSPGDGESYGDQLVKTMANRTTPVRQRRPRHAGNPNVTQARPARPAVRPRAFPLAHPVPAGARLRNEFPWLMRPSTAKQVVDTLSAVLRGTLASANDDNKRASCATLDQRARIEGPTGMSGLYVRDAKRELRRRRRQTLAYIGLALLAAVTAVVVVMALMR